MPSLVIPETIQARLVYDKDGADYAVQVLHYKVASTFVVDQTNTDDFAADVAAAWDAGAVSQRDLTSDNVRLNRVGLRDIRNPNLPLFEKSLTLAGFAAADPMPAQTAYVVTLRTSFAGRSYRGRTYLTGYAEGQNDAAGNPVANVRTAAENFMNDMLQHTVGGFTLFLAVASRTLGESNDVISVTGRDLVWDTQRRRLHGGI